MKREKLKHFRLNKDLKQYEMAEKICITKQHYSRLERGLNDPSRKLMERFKKVFPDVDVWELFEKN